MAIRKRDGRPLGGLHTHPLTGIQVHSELSVNLVILSSSLRCSFYLGCY